MIYSSSPVESCLLQTMQVKQFRWNTLFRAFRTRSLGEMPWEQPAHLVPNLLKGRKARGESWDGTALLPSRLRGPHPQPHPNLGFRVPREVPLGSPQKARISFSVPTGAEFQFPRVPSTLLRDREVPAAVEPGAIRGAVRGTPSSKLFFFLFLEPLLCRAPVSLVQEILLFLFSFLFYFFQGRRKFRKRTQ